MRTKQQLKTIGRFQAVLLAIGLTGLMASSAAAQVHTVHLIAAPLTKAVTLPDGSLASVPMWGFALDANANGILDPGEVPTVPGPRITVAPGDATLQVWLTNTLPDPVSIVVLGQKFDATPVRNVDGRIVSMTTETAPGGTQEYLFTDLKPGTFLYESGTHQAVQVQMGLYGAMTKNAAGGEDANGNGILDLSEDLNGNGILDVEDANGNGILDTEDANGNGILDTEDANGNGILDTEDANGNGILDPGEDANANGILDTEDANGNGILDTEDANTNGILDTEDANGNGILDTEDTNGNGILDLSEDLNLNGVLDLGDAYAGTPYAHEALLLYSEIDIALHQAVTDGTYGVAGLGPTSTINYKPSLFLINGESYSGELSPAIAAGVAGQTTLLRLLNAGLETHAPLMSEGMLSIIAEDGNPYPFGRSQATVQLAAQKTHDVLWTPASAAVYKLYDRMLALNAAGQAPGGMLARLSVASAAADPVTADDDSYATNEDSALAIAAPGVLDGDTGAGPLTAQIVAGTRSGTLVLTADGSFSYTPNPDFSGVDSFTYTANDGVNSSLPATVVIAVAAVPDAPIALAQEIGLDAQTAAHVALAASDADGDALTFSITSLPANGQLSYIDPLTSIETPIGAVPAILPSNLVIYTPEPLAPFSGTDSFDFAVSDGTFSSGAAVVTATVHPLEVDPTPVGTPLAISIVGSDGTPITGYKWTLEEDHMYEVVPGLADPNTLSVSFHPSYMPVRQTGDETTAPIVDPSKRYFISVLPKDPGFANGGARVDRNQGSVAITVGAGQVPTAQVYVRAFNDNAPLNGVWDTGEFGLAGFEVTIEDAGGRYGASAGDMMFDTFGNPIGTVYAECSTGPGTCTSYEVVSYGNGFVLTDAGGWALIQNLAPGKYGVKVRMPGGAEWQQTSTIEGTLVIDAWVKANEPQFFMEFGPPGPHAEVGFVQKTNDAAVLGAGAGPFTEISGRVTNLHMSRPPSYQMFSGAIFDFTDPWVALNTGAVGGTLIYAQPVNDDGTFTISGVPSGSYQLWIFDSALNIIIASRVINVTAPSTMALGDLGVFQWFTRSYNYVFEDFNENGFRDPGEPGLPEQAVNVRWRDGTINQTSATDTIGFVPFEQVFPFFSWEVMEVDYARMRATGVTVVADAGGDPNVNTDWPATVGAELDPALLAPQPQAENGGAVYRTETGPVLLQAFQGFVGQSHVLLWGKAPYREPGSVASDVNVAPFDDFPGPGDVDADMNGAFDVDHYLGGVSGIVHYSTTRAENDPRWGGAEVWEPGIPRVRVQLWDVNRTHLLNEVTTDSWDDSLPTGCQGDVFTFLGQPKDCYDGLRNWNQVRPGVFDGGYAFYTVLQDSAASATFDLPLEARGAEVPLPPGEYVVKVVVPPSYRLVKEEDKNVDFGQEFIPQQFWLTGYPLGDGGPAEAPPTPTVEEYPLYAPFCVGALREVPGELALYPGIPGAYAGEQRPLCDAKLVNARAGSNGAANFFLFTEAPIAAHIVGFVLDDTTNEYDPNSPQFGEKYAPPFMPVAIRDWTGREITRTHTDAYGRYNVMVPSTSTANVPEPSGMSPNMLTACINAPMMPDGAGGWVPDPLFQKQYSHFCYTFQYMPGTTTYLDTPVIPTAAFTGADVFPVDAELPDRTPTVASVTSLFQPSGVGTGIIPQQIGPYVVDRGGDGGIDGVFNRMLRTIQILSAGDVEVPNPLYAGATTAGGPPKTIVRDYGFGTSTANGIVRLGGLPIEVTSWANSIITAVVPTGVDYRTGQLSVERCLTGTKALSGTACPEESLESVIGVTLSVANTNMHNQRPPVVLAAGQTIQSAIDAAEPGDLVLVPPGTYNELAVMTKPIRLQGWGATSTTINTIPVPAENLQAWRDYVGGLLEANPGYLLADQANILGPAPWGPGEIAAAIGGEGAGVTVFGQDLNYNANTGSCNGTFFNPNNAAYCLHNENQGGAGGQVDRPNARVDGFSIIGSSQEAAIIANGHARFLQVSNNRIFNNLGNYAGGVRIGHPAGTFPLVDENADNRNVTIHHNWIAQNAGLGGGGGVALGTGSDGYVVSQNWIAANFSGGWGAGVTHLGLSPGGVIDDNVIVFNETFNQGLPRSGAGIFVGGRQPLATELTPGSGSVQISNNLIQGNQAAAGDGGGIALLGVNGQDAVDEPNVALRYGVSIYNNMIANNVAGLAGGGIALQDAAYVDIVHNTIAHNDSLATAGSAFGNPNQSTPQPAGIVSRGHTPLLATALGGSGFSDPRLANTIVWENRSFYFGPDPGGVIGPGGVMTYGLLVNPAGPYWDLEVLGAPAGSQLHPEYSVLTDTTGYSATNSSTAPTFVATYFNGSRNPTIIEPDGTPGIIVPAAFDEGGTFIRPQFGPLTLHQADGSLFGDYHLDSGVDGQGLNALFGGAASVPPAVLFDYDADPRPEATPHIGADQVVGFVVPTLPGIATAISATAPGTLLGTLVDFGVQPNGTFSSTITVAVSLGPVTFGPAAVMNLFGTGFSLGADTCSGSTVPAGGLCTITVNFNGTGNTFKFGTLSMTNNGLVTPLTLTLFGF